MKTQFIILIVSALILIACENDNKIIDITEQCVFKEDILTACFCKPTNWNINAIVITDNELYQNFGDSIRISISNLDCDTVSLPYIDFNKFSLIGRRTSGGGCSAYYYRQIIEDKSNQKIIYRINVVYKGNCKMLLGNWNWVIIPKLLKGYKVEFKVN